LDCQPDHQRPLCQCGRKAKRVGRILEWGLRRYQVLERERIPMKNEKIRKKKGFFTFSFLIFIL
jgi:hypothetical protein